MSSRFAPTQKLAIDALLGGAGAKPKSALEVSQVRQALDLPEIPYRQFLGPDCWLAVALSASREEKKKS